MKKPSILIFSLISLSFFIINGCTKDEQPLVKLDQDFLSYFAFPVGSWWTYKEVNTGKTDSFYVNYFKIENETIKKAVGDPIYEILVYHLFSRNDTAYGYATPTYSITMPKDSIKYTYVESYHSGPNGFDYSANRFIYKIAPGQLISGPGYLYVEHSDTITIQGKKYENIYFTNNPKQAYYNPIKSEYYCRNVGVIKREYFDGSVWELTNYHLNK